MRHAVGRDTPIAASSSASSSCRPRRTEARMNGKRMTWEDVKRTLTTPPPPRPPPPKYPLFTKDPFSTTSFGPGHLVGAVGLIGGLFLFTRYFVRRGQAQAAEFQRSMAQRAPLPPGSPPQPQPHPDEPKVARAENERGQYGKGP